MTNQTLEKILININQSFYGEENFALRKIDNNIDLININDICCVDKNNHNFYDFILLKNKDLNSKMKYIGIVLDMINDLHFYIILDFRGKGYLQESMNTSILPFFSCYKNRTKQKLSFDELKIKEYFISQFDFKSIGNLEVEKDLNSEDIKLYDAKDEKSTKLTGKLKEKMIKNLNDAILKVRMINRQVSYGKYNTFEYDKDYLQKTYWKIKDDISYND